jgi:negative regulator of sigma E activity
MAAPDDLDNYMRGGSALSRHYRSEPAPGPPHGLDRRVLRIARRARGRSPCLAPLAFAASVLLSVAMVLAIVFGPQAAKRVDDSPHLVRVAAHGSALPKLYRDSPHARAPARWLEDIAALRRAGRDREADSELRRFHDAFPDYPAGGVAMRR